MANPTNSVYPLPPVQTAQPVVAGNKLPNALADEEIKPMLKASPTEAIYGLAVWSDRQLKLAQSRKQAKP